VGGTAYLIKDQELTHQEGISEQLKRVTGVAETWVKANTMHPKVPRQRVLGPFKFHDSALKNLRHERNNLIWMHSGSFNGRNWIHDKAIPNHQSARSHKENKKKWYGLGISCASKKIHQRVFRQLFGCTQPYFG